MDARDMHLTDADNASYDSVSQILKAATAYVSPSAGKLLAVFSKLIELQHMVEYLDSGEVSACGTDGRRIPPEEMIRDLRKYCGPREKEQLDKCLNIMNMAKMYEIYKNLSGTGESFAAADMANLRNMTSSSRAQSPPYAARQTFTKEPPSASENSGNDYLRQMQSMLTPEQLQLLNTISSQQHI